MVLYIQKIMHMSMEILQILTQGCTNVSDHFRNFPNITGDVRRFPRRSENVSIVKRNPKARKANKHGRYLEDNGYPHSSQ